MSPRTIAPLFLVGLVLLSANLRPAAVSVGPVLAETRAGLGLSGAEAGLLTSLPVVAFAVFGALAPVAARRLGIHRVTLVALLALTLGLVGRAVVGDDVAFLGLSMVALAGMALANVLIPALVKLHAPDRVGQATAIYTTALAVGLTAALMLTVPISDALDGWRWGLGAWAVLALLAVLPWLGLIAHDRAPEPSSHLPFGRVLRTPLGMAMAGCFGLQSLQAYVIFGWFAQLWRDSGYSPTAAGLLVGLIAGVSIPLSAWLPRLLASSHRPRAVLLGVIAFYPVGYVGLLLAPHALAVVWALAIGVGTCAFQLVLTLIGLRARTAPGTAALSATTQSVGYLFAATGPFVVGVVHDATGSWTAPVLLLLVLVVPLALLFAYAGRPIHVEDQLGAPDAATTTPG